MFEIRHRTTRSDMRSLVKEAKALVRETSAFTGDQADALRHEGLKLLETGIVKVQAIDDAARAAGRAIVKRAHGAVQENPRRAVAITGAVSLCIGMLLGWSLAQKK